MPTPGIETQLASSFKVTEALGVVSPGADEPEPVSGPFDLRWLDDASENFYTVVVYDAFGELVWCRSSEIDDCDILSVSGDRVAANRADLGRRDLHDRSPRPRTSAGCSSSMVGD